MKNKPMTDNPVESLARDIADSLAKRGKVDMKLLREIDGCNAFDQDILKAYVKGFKYGRAIYLRRSLSMILPLILGSALASVFAFSAIQKPPVVPTKTDFEKLATDVYGNDLQQSQWQCEAFNSINRISPLQKGALPVPPKPRRSLNLK